MNTNKVKLVEVSPRDGLQNEIDYVPTDIKVELINKLSETGLTTIECTSFVSPKWIPQLKDANEVMSSIAKKSGILYPVLVPNMHGFNKALDSKVDTIAVFGSASEEFSKKNINCSIKDSLTRMSDVAKAANDNKMQVRGYISCVLGCPYQGEVDIKNVVSIAKFLDDIGCYEISLGDTIGVGTINSAKNLIKVLKQEIDINKLAVHFHDTYGQALVNIYACLEEGISIVDSSVAGLGGCPYAKGSSGNVATEDVVHMLNGLNIETGVSVEKLLGITKFLIDKLGYKPRSKLSLAKL